MDFERFNVGTRISIGFAALIRISLTLAGFGVPRLGTIATGSPRITGDNARRVLEATRRAETARTLPRPSLKAAA